MSKLTFLLLFTAPLISLAQPCEPSTAVQDRIKEANRQPDRKAAVRALLTEFPKDVWVHRVNQDSMRQGPLYGQAAIDQYKDLLAKNPDDAEFLYLYGRTLVGTKTPEAITLFERALAKDAKYAPARLSLVEIYRAPNFKDPQKATENLKAWMEACPAQLDGFRFLERMEPSEFVRNSVMRMRSLLESRSDEAAVAQYPVLWRLEFQTHPAPEYGQVKENVRKDLARLSELDPANKPMLGSALREGYKLVDDAEGLRRVENELPKAPGTSAAIEAYNEWEKAHPYPQPKQGQKFNPDELNKRNRALLDATAEWIQKWPDQSFVWSQRMMALQVNRETPDSEVDRAVEGMRRAAKSVTGNGSPWEFQAASLYLQRKMHLNEIPGMVQQGLEKLDKVPEQRTSDLFPAQSGAGMQSMRFMQRAQGLLTLVDVYQQTDQPQMAMQALAEFRKTLDENRPDDSDKGFGKLNWARQEAMYWDRMAQAAEKQGRKLDALTFYQNQMRASAIPGDQQHVKLRAKPLWTDLGGTDAGWEAWLAKIEPVKPVTAATTTTTWEKMNRPLPELGLTDMRGKTWRLTDIKGKTTLINLWATWCGPCKMELPHLQKLYEKMKDREDIRILTLNTDDNPGLIESFLKENKYTFPVLPARAYVDQLVPSLSIPRNWIVDNQAVLKLESIGFGNNGDKWMEDVTEAMAKTR